MSSFPNILTILGYAEVVKNKLITFKNFWQLSVTFRLLQIAFSLLFREFLFR